MKKYKTTYHIYDDFGELLRISLDKPKDKSYTFESVKEIVFDTDMLEEALF